MSKFEDYLEALKANDKAQELLGGKYKPDNDEEMVARYVAVAKELGFDLTAEDVIDGFKAMAQERLKKTEQAESELRELSIDDLDNIAGGVKGHDNCKDTYLNYENCWWDDGCDLVNNDYGKEYKCKNNVEGPNKYNPADCGHVLF